MQRTMGKWGGGLALLIGAALLWTQTAAAGPKLLRLRLDGPVREAPSDEFDLSFLAGLEKPKTLRELTEAVRRAGADKDVAGLLLIIEQPRMSLAQAEELTRALGQFRERGKKVHCYLDHGNNLSYALACAADHITLAEYSELAIVGLNGEVSFYKGLLDKIGVQADLLQCGAYKGAAEPFMRTEPSKELAENVNWLLDGIFERWLGLMAAGRKLSVEEVRGAVDAAPLTAEQALKRKLVDAVSSFAAFRKMIRDKYGQDVEIVKKLGDDKTPTLDFEGLTDLMTFFQELVAKPEKSRKAGVGLIYIEGGIELGKAMPGMFGEKNAGSTTIRAALAQAADDPNIKAVVVRVNSPGGSALASDIMWDAATRCAADKPLIVSMGGVAGSGGYYVALPGQVILAEESTITGSIGVLGGKLVWAGLMEDKLGITTAEFPRGKHAALMSLNRPWTEAEREFFRKYIEGVYAQFKGRVKQSRGERLKGDLEQMAGGRVFTGKQALERGLIDRLGGLQDALELAAKKANLDPECPVYLLPKPLGLMDLLKQLMGEEPQDDYQISLARGAGGDQWLPPLLPLLQQVAPQQARRLMTDLRNLVIIQQERVGCFMPPLSFR